MDNESLVGLPSLSIYPLRSTLRNRNSMESLHYRDDSVCSLYVRGDVRGKKKGKGRLDPGKKLMLPAWLTVLPPSSKQRGERMP